MGRKNEWEHGGWSYTNHGCRCPVCTADHTAYLREARARRMAAPTPEHVHGTNNGYRNYGCHCDRCKAAHRAERARERQRANEKAAS